MAVAIAVIFAAIFSLLTLAILALFGMGVCSLTTKGRCTMLGKILLGVLGARFSLLMLVALSWTVLVFRCTTPANPSVRMWEGSGSSPDLAASSSPP
jgi:hypothetical protein